MGSRLRRELREALPTSIKGLPRAVALEIADDARWNDGWRYNPEAGRRSKASLSDLARWTASKNERVISEALRVLALAGWEFRVPFGKGKDGRLLYAVPGRAVEFRVPDFEAPTLVGSTESEGPVTTGPSGQGPVATGPLTPEGPVTTAEGPVVTAEGPVTTASESVVTGPPSLVPPTSHKDPITSSSHDGSSADDSMAEVPEGGGGGGESPSKEISEHIAAHLDYRGKPPDKRQRQTLTDRLIAALDSGWSVDGLAYYLDLGTAQVDSPAAVYAHRLRPDILPDAEPLPAPVAAPGGIRGDMPTAAYYEALTVDSVFGPARRDTADGGLWERAMARAQARSAGIRPGTDTTVAGWGDVARQLAAEAKHKPYSNDPWTTPADPVKAAKIPFCGHWDCDSKTRLRGGQVCPDCHPAWRF